MQYTTSPVIERQVEVSTARSGPRTARCADLARAVGQLDLDDPLFTGSLLAAAVNAYAAQAGRQWRFDPVTRPALLLRALSKLSIHAPDARSASARVLVDALNTSLRGAS